MEHETIIGLEIHVQVKTRSKMFCACPVEFGGAPNTRVCPVCLGLPGALPVVNRQAIELAVRAAQALNCDVHPRSLFARKNYFYPDLPKGYQISQFDHPLATGGWLELTDGEAGTGHRVRIRRLHVEEDAGKSLHDRFAGQTAIDLNRAGVPLIEIVTEPDLRSAEQARTFLGLLKQALEYLDVSDCNMEEGSLRVDANVSVRPLGSTELSTKTELKNMNSFSQLEKALAFEVRRHMEVLAADGVVEHQTMLWDPTLGEARPMRGKEEIHDYRYFPEPDLGKLEVDPETVARIAAQIPELPWERVRRFQRSYGVPLYDAEVLCARRPVADFYEAVVEAGSDPKAASNWIMGEMMAISNDLGRPIEDLPIDPEGLAEVIARVGDGTLSHGLGKQVLRRMAETGKACEVIVEEEGLRVVGDADRIADWARAAVEAHPVEVRRFQGGEEKLLGFFIGQVMQRSGGRADPGRVRSELLRVLREVDVTGGE